MYVCKSETLYSFSLKYIHITDWETTLLGHQVELEWRLRVFPSAFNLWFWISLHQGTLLFLYSKTYIAHVINCKWSRSVNFPLHMYLSITLSVWIMDMSFYCLIFGFEFHRIKVHSLILIFWNLHSTCYQLRMK